MRNIIGESKKAFPQWLKDHPVFAAHQVDKVFPKLGLKNFREPIDINQSIEAQNAAKNLGTQLSSQLSYVRNEVHTKMWTELLTQGKNNELCAKYQTIVHLIDSVRASISYGDYVKLIDKKLQIRLRADVFYGGSSTPVFKKDESILRVAGKLFEMVKETNKAIQVCDIDQLHEFKEYSRLNVPSKQYTAVFSSTGEEGLWDMATISMRGIASCQSWSAPQSRGLIGNISSRYAGVIFVESDQDIAGYGKKMLFRCLVRLAVYSNRPILVIDTMYPGSNSDVLAAFKSLLTAKTGLSAYFYTEMPNGGTMPDEPGRKHWKVGEVPYMDHPIAHSAYAKLIKKPQFDSQSFVETIVNEVSAKVATQRSVYQAAEKNLEEKLAEWQKAKEQHIADTANLPEQERPKFELDRPKMDSDLIEFGKGGVMNLLKHCDKKHGAESGAKLFARRILTTMNTKDCRSVKDFTLCFFKQANLAQEAKKGIETGTWMKSFPKSSDRFFNYTLAQVKTAIKKQSLETFKKAN